MNKALRNYSRDRLVLREVGLRDGLQLAKSFPSTDAKKKWIKREYAAGVRHFEVGSFLPSGRFPQFADVGELISTVSALENAFSAALALNEHGADDALNTDVDEIVCVVSATEEHSQANMRRSRSEAVDLVHRVCQLRDQSGHKAIVNVGISMAFGCSIAGMVEPEEVLRLVDRLIEAGADLIGLADTVGVAGPLQIADLVEKVGKIMGDKPIIIHLHDTRGLGIANASAALDSGIRILDGSLGGLGGCPFAPGATGNIVFEDLVFLCEMKGFATGIDPDALLSVRQIAEANMPEENFFGGIARAGTPSKIKWKASH
jgi:hydroxymethylglutaryl-CoA lyase